MGNCYSINHLSWSWANPQDLNRFPTIFLSLSSEGYIHACVYNSQNYDNFQISKSDFVQIIENADYQKKTIKDNSIY